ncbi:hypothetical protein N566_16060 [Streptomycetaceae bacterium MP113-05]|nr:hypothetical protein N566_16060 [Streptomycetaceae bacterium MP113-05]
MGADDLLATDASAVGLVLEAGEPFRFVGVYEPEEPEV